MTKRNFRQYLQMAFSKEVQRPDAWYDWVTPEDGEIEKAGYRLRECEDGWWAYSHYWACGAIGPYASQAEALSDARGLTFSMKWGTANQQETARRARLHAAAKSAAACTEQLVLFTKQGNPDQLFLPGVDEQQGGSYGS